MAAMSDTDLIYHLKRRSDGVARDAAAAIERLTKELEVTQESLEAYADECHKAERERDELKKQLEIALEPIWPRKTVASYDWSIIKKGEVK